MNSSRVRDGVAGAVSAGLALGASELVAGFLAAFPSLVEALGNFVVDRAPAPLKDFAIEVFGTADKLVLLISITVVTVLIGAVVGMSARARFGIAVIAFSGFGLLAAVAATRDPQVGIGLALVPAGAAVLAGLGALHALLGLGEAEGSTDADGSRRNFLVGAGAVLGLALIAGVAGRMLIERAKQMVAGREEVVLPSPATALPPIPEAADLAVTDLTPILVPNDDFYRIDTALSVPRVSLQDWSLTVSGRVDRPYTIDFPALLDMRMVERDITLACVSNPVGGGLVGNARWQGVPLAEILDRAGVRDDAEQIVGRSVDQFTVGFPVEAAFDGREALVAVGMNGEPLPFEHGFPARLVVAGLYGYVSATKWLTEIALTGWEEFDAYWVPRGWSKEAPIKTQSRIDTPGRAERISPGPRKVAGVAWAPTLGISKVEVQLGGGAPWTEAMLSEPLSENAWVQWQIDWAPEPGEYFLSVRATDGEGVLQDEVERPPAPDGATGWHTQRVVVEEM